MVSNKNLSTAIYVRVSTEEQVQEGYSIRAQSEKLKAYSLIKDWEIYDLYADEGISGKNIVDRPAINTMIADIKSGKVNNVLVFKVDRLTRNTKNLIELVELFEENNCAFNSLTESIDTDTPSGRMFLKIIGIFAEFERENLVSRLKMGYERKVKEGYTLATNTFSYGYNRKKGNKIQEVVAEEAKIVKEIFQMYVEDNMSLGKIAKILNERKIATKNKTNLWTVTAVRRILTNPTYIGKVRYSIQNEEKYFEADGHHEKILSDETFYLAQEKIKNMQNISKTKKPKENSYFCGVLVCSLCGGKFTTHHKSYVINEQGDKRYRTSYRCSNKIYYNNDVACNCPNIIHDKIEKAFSAYVEQINSFTELEGYDLENDNNADKKHEQQEYISKCESKLNNLHNKKKRVMEQYVNEEITFEEYKELLNILNRKYEMLECELEKAESEMRNKPNDFALTHEDIIENLKENWQYLDNKERMMFLQKFVKKVVIAVERERANSNVVRIEEVVYNC